MPRTKLNLALLTGNQPREQALTHAGGFPEKGSHSHERADVQPARSRQGFLSSSGRPTEDNGDTGANGGTTEWAIHIIVRWPASL